MSTMTEITTRPTPAEVRSSLVLALDVDDLVQAQRMARAVQPYFGVVKVGMELFTAAGPEAIGTFADMGFDVFMDMKLHDTPSVVGRAASVLGSLGVSYLTMHAHGGVTMLRAGVEGLHGGAERAGLPAPAALAITVLVSDDDAPDHIVPKRLRVAMEGGCQGIICAVDDVRMARQIGPRLLTVVDGIAPVEQDQDGPSPVSEARLARDRGASLLVVGSAVSASSDPVAVAQQLVGELTD